MARRKAAENCLLLPWQTAKKDCREKRFTQLGNTILLTRKDSNGKETNEFLNLSCGERFLYLCMVMEAGGKRTFTFPLSAARKYGYSNSSFRKQLETLVEKRFIERASGKNTREANVYTFCSDWKLP